MLADNQIRKSNHEDFESNLKNITDSMLLCERNGDYVTAENLRIKSLQYKKKWEDF